MSKCKNLAPPNTMISLWETKAPTLVYLHSVVWQRKNMLFIGQCAIYRWLLFIQTYQTYAFLHISQTRSFNGYMKTLPQLYNIGWNIFYYSTQKDYATLIARKMATKESSHFGGFLPICTNLCYRKHMQKNQGCVSQSSFGGFALYKCVAKILLNCLLKCIPGP